MTCVAPWEIFSVPSWRFLVGVALALRFLGNFRFLAGGSWLGARRFAWAVAMLTAGSSMGSTGYRQSLDGRLRVPSALTKERTGDVSDFSLPQRAPRSAPSSHCTFRATPVASGYQSGLQKPPGTRPTDPREPENREEFSTLADPHGLGTAPGRGHCWHVPTWTDGSFRPT